MRKIAIIGSGQAGLLCAHGLRRAGYSVTLYSDRTPEAWLSESRPTGAAGRFGASLAYERELGLNHWESQAPRAGGAYMIMCPAPGNRLLSSAGCLREYGLAIDLRLQSHRWMIDLEERGGKVEIENITLPRLEEIAAENDLTVVATGKGPFSGVFERDAARSVHSEPQRQLAMLCVKGLRMRDPAVPYIPIKFAVLDGLGEAFWIPYHHKDVGPSHCLLFEAVPGGDMDRFRSAKSASELLGLMKKAIKELIPWDHEWVKDAEVSDELGWLVGSLRPDIKKPVGRLPSGKTVIPLGDAAMAIDPIAGQGANNGNKMAKNLVESIALRQDRPFDEAWMTDTFERFWERHGRHSAALTNMLLAPPSNMAKAYLVAQYGSDGRAERTDGAQRLANAFAENFADPALLMPTLLDDAKTKAFIQETTGSFWGSLARNVPGILRAQVRQRLGMDPGFPKAPAV